MFYLLKMIKNWIINLILLISFTFLGCQGREVEWREVGVFSEKGGEMEKEGVSILIPEGALKEEVEISLEKRASPSHPIPKGYILAGDVVNIHPRGMVFRKPVEITLRYHEEKISKEMREELLSLFYHNGIGWVEIGDSRLDPEKKRISSPLYHAIELAPFRREREYGMVEHPWKKGRTPLVLIHGASPYDWDGLKKFLRKKGYPNPLWVFEYGVDQGIRESAELLSRELRNLHQEYGDFKVNILGYDVGGLVGFYYALKDELYQDDIEKILITIGTPHYGTPMADPSTLVELIEKAEEFGGKLSPQDVEILFSFSDALGSKGKDLKKPSEFLDELQQLQRDYSKKFHESGEEGKPLFKIECFSGDRVYPLSLDLASLIPDPPSEIVSGEGDTYISVKKTMLSPIENAPFYRNHFDLLKDERVFQDILGYLEVEPFYWLRLLEEISSHEGRRKIVETWEREFMLNQNDPRSLEFILDFGRNLLNSCEPEAILFTNGDNDTYPLWWVQEKEGKRKDVAVVNLSLLNTANFIKFLKGSPHRLPISFTDEEIDSLKPKEREGKTLYVNEQVIDNLIVTNGWKRPIYFAVTCMRNLLREPRNLEGLVYRLLEEGEGEEVDIERCRNNLYKIYRYGKLLNEKGERDEGIDPDIEKVLYMNYASIYLRVGVELQEKGDLEEATREFQQAIRFIPKSHVLRIAVADQYEKMGRLNKAESELKESIELSRDYFPAYKSLVSLYKKTGRQREGIRLLAKWIERHPEDEEAIQFLKEQTEGIRE